MTTNAQHNANGRNAKKSTGPRTRQGKAQSSRNAVQHGAYAEELVAIRRGVFEEDPNEVAAYVQGIVESLAPRDAIEVSLANQIAFCMLRLRRSTRFETEAIAGTDRRRPGPQDPEDPRSVEYYEEQLAHDLGQQARTLFDHTLANVSRVESRNSLALDRALSRYRKLHERDLSS